MAEPDSTERWARALRELWRAAGEPTGGEIERQGGRQRPRVRVTSSSWSEWRNGKNVPADPDAARFLVTYLRARARTRTPSYVAPDDAWWERTWRSARAERSGKGGRPATAHHTPPAEPVPRVREGVVPRAADCFQQREAAARLTAAVDESGTVVLTQVLLGMGGVGKTQLAAAHARRAWAAGTQVLVWVNAATRDGIVTAYARTARRLGLPLAEPDDPGLAAETFLTWAETTDRSWLVVLDDVRRPADVNGLWPVADTSVGGRVVVTTRLREAALSGSGRRIVDIGVFTAEEARAYLTAKLPAPQDPSELAALAADLGHLPIWLAQAAAYIVDDGSTVPAYRRRLATQLLARSVPGPDSLPDDHERIASATWELSIGHADRTDPVGLARPLLQLAAVLDGAGIPQTALTSPPALDHLTDSRQRGAAGSPDHPRRGEETAVDAAAVDRALRVLHRHSLLDHDRNATHQEVRVHQLIQRATRESLVAGGDAGPESLTRLVRAAADSLLHRWPETAPGELGPVLRANAAALRDTSGAALFARDTGAHPVLTRAITDLGRTGQVGAALTASQGLADACLRHLGPEHRSTLAARNNLAYWQGEAGDTAGASTAFQELVSDMLRVLGPDDRDTLSARGNLARCQGLAGDAGKAAATFEELLADTLRVYGPDAPETLTTRNNLAYFRGLTGDAAGAVAAYEELVSDHLRVQGPDAYLTLVSRINLTRWRGEAGITADAVPAHETLLADVVRVLGPDAPETLITRRNLAFARGTAGDTAGAAAELEGLLADQSRVLGPDHPDTLTTRHHLASWAGQSGDLAGAVAALRALLPDRLRVLGADAPDTLVTRNNLAYFLGMSGDAEGAAATFRELLDDRLRILGPDAPDTLTTRANLAAFQALTGDRAGAVVALEELLADQTRVLGPDHTGTLSTRNNLAHWLGEEGDAAGAATALAELHADIVRAHGPDSLLALKTRSGLGRWLGEAGDQTGAVTTLEALLADQVRIQGPDHPDTSATREQLERWRGRE
ncbi:FxSxx-COOH system tetratricopeptide repeat protein [Streptomyces sp. NPDC006997]|uniref:FxSxx-COOH system tetratricopeptide repeat protein n=1 Tax=Streptomyces sp. NPDC006997 TaxID=3155356 RepID=UPI00340FCF83